MVARCRFVSLVMSAVCLTHAGGVGAAQSPSFATSPRAELSEPAAWRARRMSAEIPVPQNRGAKW